MLPGNRPNTAVAMTISGNSGAAKQSDLFPVIKLSARIEVCVSQITREGVALVQVSSYKSNPNVDNGVMGLTTTSVDMVESSSCLWQECPTLATGC